MAKIASADTPIDPGTYGTVLRAVRKHKGLSLAKVAARINDRPGLRLHLGFVEKGAEGASLPLVAAWSRALGMDLVLRKGDEQLTVSEDTHMGEVTAWIAEQGIAPTDLAVLARMSRMTVAAWRKGAARPRFESVQRVMTALDGDIRLVRRDERVTSGDGD